MYYWEMLSDGHGQRGIDFRVFVIFPKHRFPKIISPVLQKETPIPKGVMTTNSSPFYPQIQCCVWTLRCALT